MRFLLVLFFPFLLGFTLAEIHYDPAGSDNGKEYLEVQHIENASLENFTIEDNAHTDVLHALQFAAGTISLIVDDDFNLSGIPVSVYTAGSAIGNGLNNDKDMLRLKNREGILVDEINYTSSLGGKNGRSLCRENNSLLDCNATPGWIAQPAPDINSAINISLNLSYENASFNATNITIPSPENLSNTSGNISLNQSSPYSFPIPVYYSLEITEVMVNPKGDDRNSYPDGEWVEIYNLGATSVPLEGLVLSDEKGNTVKLGQSNFFDGLLPSFSYSTAYLNGWSILNNEGDTISLSLNGTLLDRMSYGPIQEGFSWSKLHGIWKKTLPSPSSPNTEPQAVPATEALPEAAFVRFHESPSTVTLGKTFTIAIAAHPGTSRGSTLRLTFDPVLPPLQISLNGITSNISLRIPLSLPSCQKKNITQALLRIEGFGTSDEKLIAIHGPSCPSSRETAARAPLEQKPRYPLTLPDPVPQPENLISTTGEVVYESSGMQAKGFAIYIFSFLLICLIIYLIGRKHL